MREWEALAGLELQGGRMGRRPFLTLLQVAAGGLALALGVPEAVAEGAAASEARRRVAGAGPGFSPNVFLHVAPDGWVTVVCHRSEMGQGVRSSIPVLLADELGADMARVRIQQADGDAVYGDQNTDGSSSVRGHYDQLRQVAATARTILVRVGARRLGVKPSECTALDHRVQHPASGRFVDFAALALLAEREPLPVPESVELRPDSELHHVGRALPLLDAKAYVTGTAIFGADVRLPGMLIAVIARPPVVGGKVASFDEAAARGVPGVRQVLRMPDPKPPYAFQPWGGVAVLADDTWSAQRGRNALAVQWNEGEHQVYDSAEYRKALQASVSAPGTVVRRVGDVEAALKSAARVVEAEYYVPHLPHAPMEPPVAVARVSGDHCEVWAPTQNPQAARKEAARVLGVPEANVTVHVTFLGGAFGRKSKADFVAEAVWLAREAGAPVRVQWTREDDFHHDYYNTVSLQRMRAGLDARGKVIAWYQRSAFPPIGTVFGGGPTPSAGDFQQGVSDVALDVPNVQAEGCQAPPAHVRIGWLRSVYNIFHAFSTNCFIDEIATAKGADARDVMLEVYGPPRQITSIAELGVQELRNYGASLEQHPVDAARLRGVIERVTESAGWRDRKRAGRALGLAAHRSFLSYTAAVASVVKLPNGKLHVDEVWLAIDAGKIVNLDRVRSQLEGSAIFGMSIALYGEMSMKAGVTEQNNFRELHLVRIGAAPRAIHVDVVPSNARSGGVGEPGVPPVAPAIANAVFALTGQRVRDLPLSKVFAV
jgi:isoquinoline 1-oxidoreductase beta subunit